MKTNKQWKRVPFDIELAKKIQSGEAEGRIVTRNGCEARILAFNIRNISPIIAAVLWSEKEYIYSYGEDGKYISNDEFRYDLFIELPEETVNQKGELTLGQCKEGDEVWIFSGYDYGPEYVKVKVGKFSLDTSSGRRRDVTFENGFTCQELTCQMCWYENPDEQKTKTKEFIEETSTHEFKPFDKVLVRDGNKSKWRCSFYSYTDNNGHCCIDGHWPYMISYEGNEHLVGTTDKPKED